MPALIATVGLDITRFQQGWKKAVGIADYQSHIMAGRVKGMLAGMFGTAAIEETIRRTFNRAKELHTLAQRTGVDVETLQKREYAMKKTGGSMEDYVSTLEKLGEARQRALDEPLSETAKAFKDFGISIDDLQKKNADALFVRIGDSIRKAANPQQILGRAVELMGRSAPLVFSAMRNGLEQVGQKAKDAGKIVDEELNQKFIEAGKTLEDFKPKLEKWVTIGLGRMIDNVVELTREVKVATARRKAETEYRKEHPQKINYSTSGEFAGTPIVDFDPKIEDEARRAGEKVAAQMWEGFRLEDERRKSKKLPPIPFVGRPKTEPFASFSHPNLTEWQRIGAFAYTNPVVSEQKIATAILKEIQKNTAKALQVKPGDGLGLDGW